jgi:predicted nucleic acid-binding protein
MSPPQPGPAGSKKSISRHVMRFVLGAHASPHIAEVLLASPSKISPEGTTLSRGRRPGRGAPSESLTAERRLRVLRLDVSELPLTGDIAIVAAELHRLHADLADRLIVATAVATHATLLTADDRILAWRAAGTRR